MTNHVFGVGLAFLGFAASLLIGIFVNNSYGTVILRALGVMIVFYILGCLFSAIGFKVIQENFEAEIEETQAESESQPTETRSAGDDAANPLPEMEKQTAAS